MFGRGGELLNFHLCLTRLPLKSDRQFDLDLHQWLICTGVSVECSCGVVILEDGIQSLRVFFFFVLILRLGCAIESISHNDCG